MILELSDGVAKLQPGSDHTFTVVEMLSLAVTVFLLSFTFTIRLDLRKHGAGIVKYINEHVDRLDTGQESRDKPFDICYNEGTVSLISVFVTQDYMIIERSGVKTAVIGYIPDFIPSPFSRRK